MVETPHLSIDGAKMKKNIEKMAAIAERNGVALRPHVKTHKIPAIAQAQVEAGAAGITVAKVSEAEVMADAGLEDIFIAYPLVTDSKIRRAVELAQKLKKIIVGVDSLEGARRLWTAAGDQVMEVRLEIDTGLRRTGVAYDEAVELAREIDAFDNLDLSGIYTYRGAVLGGSPTLDRKNAGLEEGDLMMYLADWMREREISIREVSLGSTPTAEYAAEVEGVTEIRPGTYVFYDRMQARLGACSLDECAATVVCTVVSRPHEDLAVIDGGSKTFATDVQPGIEPLNLEGVRSRSGVSRSHAREAHRGARVARRDGRARSEGGRHAADHPEPRLQHGKPPRRGLSGRRERRGGGGAGGAARGKVW
jgi:D-serine deaminase-like pyridoxal phosphate-dependent protein